MSAPRTTKKAPAAGGHQREGENPNPFERNESMLTVPEILAADDAGTLTQLLEAEAERYQREILELFARRQMLLRNTLNTMRELGAEVELAHTWTKSPPQRGMLCESYEFRAGKVWRHHFSYFAPHKGDCRPLVRLTDEQLIIGHGTYELLHSESRTALVRRVPGVDDFEEGHRRSAAHVRNIARREDLKVSVHDRDVTLSDPTGTVLHTGTVLTTLAFIAGVDLNTPAEEPIE